MEEWAAEELEQVDLGDARRNKQLKRLVEDLASQPNSSVPQAYGDVASTSAAYDLWNSPYFQPSDIHNGHIASTIKRIKKHSVILAIQDTTNIDLTHHPKSSGLGHLDHRKTFGLKVHSTLKTTTSGVPLGIINQQVWARDIENLGIAKKRRKRQTKDKESQRWLDSLKQTQTLVPNNIQVITVADSEADIFDLFIQKRPESSHLLIRGTHNRKVDHTAQYLHQAINQTPASGTLTVEVKRNPERPARQAKLTLKFTTLDIQVPLHHIAKKQLEPVKLQVVLASEENPPTGVKAISWLLLTTVPVNDFSSAVQCVKWYTSRWLIERYHYVLKSCCGIEKLQLETAKQLMALATYSIVAWRFRRVDL